MPTRDLDVTVGTAGRHVRRIAFGMLLLTTVVGCSGGSAPSANPTPTPTFTPTATLQSIAVTPGTASIAAGLTQQFSVVATYSDGTRSPITTGIAWSSSASGSCAIDSKGLAAAVAATPAVTIVATHTSTGLTASATLTVTPAVLQAITVSPGTASVAKGQDQQFTATGTFSDGTKMPLASPTWGSSSSSVATVDSVGLASTVLVGGPVTITATDGATGVSGTATLTVTDAVLTLIDVTPTFSSVVAGFSRQLTVIGFFSDGTSGALTSGVAWSSDNTAAATMGSSAGMVLGVAPGTATITATHAASGLAAFASISVTPTPPPPTAFAYTGPISTTLDGSGPSRFRLTGLDPLTEYLVSLTPADPDAPRVLVQVHGFASFDAPLCTAFAGAVPCRGGSSSPTGELFVLAEVEDGALAPGALFTLTATPLQVVQAPAALTGASVDRGEAYFKVEGLTAGALFTASLDGLGDDADLYVYDGPHGPFGSATVCSSINGSTLAERCGGTVPASGAVYVTVEGWLTAAGTAFDLSLAN